MTLDEAIGRGVFMLRKRSYSDPLDHVSIHLGDDGFVAPEARLHGKGQTVNGEPIWVKGRALEWDWLEWSHAWAKEEIAKQIARDTK